MNPSEALASRVAPAEPELLPRRTCAVPGCITILRLDRPDGDETCSPCKHRHACVVCSGRGTVGKDQSRECYRCQGTGKRPDSLLDARRRRA